MALVMCIAAANIANLLLAVPAGRREGNWRCGVALGATRAAARSPSSVRENAATCRRRCGRGRRSLPSGLSKLLNAIGELPEHQSARTVPRGLGWVRRCLQLGLAVARRRRVRLAAVARRRGRGPRRRAQGFDPRRHRRRVESAPSPGVDRRRNSPLDCAHGRSAGADVQRDQASRSGARRVDRPRHDSAGGAQRPAV